MQSTDRSRIMIRMAAIALPAGPAATVVAPALLATTILPIATSAAELTSTRSQRPCAAKKSQKLRSATPPSQSRENRRVLMGWPPKWKPLPGHGY